MTDSILSLCDSGIDSFIAFDIETTGLRRTEDIIEIGALRIREGRAVKRFGALIKPRKPVPFQIQQITGITNEMLADAPAIEDVMPAFLHFIGDDILLGHNIASFDMKFICREAEKLGHRIKNPIFDTLGYAPRLKKQAPLPESLSLTSLTGFFGVERDNCHRAYDDALANVKVFYYLRALERTIKNT